MKKTMKLMKSNKIFLNISATVLAASVVVSTTYAWQSFDQQALNEMFGSVELGGRLHTDFDGVSKNVYVENFTSAEEGSNIFARVRLYEYMEVGTDAGEKDTMLMNTNIDKLGGPATDINDITTWDIVHLKSTGILDGLTILRDHVTILGGGQGEYMPTFNKDGESNLGDINGTLAGNDTVDKLLDDAYSDFVLYTVDPGDGGLDFKDGFADYGGTTGLVYEMHYTADTLDATLITMKDWQDLGSPKGEFWVFDVDGWAYWAQPIEPETATGLLLTELQTITTLQSSWYYEINARGQYATAGDWGAEDGGDGLATGFYIDGVTQDALDLLDIVSAK